MPRKKTNTGLPYYTKTAAEKLSGVLLNDVKVHHNTDRPEQLGALAYAQGTDINTGSACEEHLPHEAWHVVQQVQGRVKPTGKIKGCPVVNNGEALEKEADAMGTKNDKPG